MNAATNNQTHTIRYALTIVKTSWSACPEKEIAVLEGDYGFITDDEAREMLLPKLEGKRYYDAWISRRVRRK